MSIARSLSGRVEEVFEFTESDAAIHFRRSDAMVEVTANYVGSLATLEHAELSREAERFLRRVVDDFMRSYPAVGEKPVIAELPRHGGLGEPGRTGRS